MSPATHENTQTRPMLSVQDYLLTSDEWEPDAEYVDGEIEERPMGVKSHGRWQQAIQLWFSQHREAWGIEVYPEVRVRTGPTRFRIPDVLVLDADAPDEEVITHPPTAVFEVLSPQDRLPRMMRKLGDYAAMGIEGIYVVEPSTGVFQRFSADGKLEPVQECSAGRFRFPTSDIAALARPARQRRIE